ncbi:M12 family metallopeptidase [Mesorhizobium sp.]|uniref:M12 family metallopeptidase n=1 Tax=Mesorhizobium sp. TaxID=1871066 RepID=UPI000FE8CC07|nr:M12 family metallopeptidase [Mesorhizobium sp.]RWM34902.1 MAG: hypothetical protein EOR75_25030 [Mesorhizobium sp.]
MRLLAILFFFLLPLSGADAGVTVNESMNIKDLVGERRITFDQKGEFLFGDIIIKKAEISELGAVTFRRWTGGKIVYQFDPSLTPTQRQTFIGACNAWTAGTPLTCVERTNETNFVRVRTHNGDQCGGAWNSCSELGMQKGGQDLWIYKEHWNGYNTVIQHEVGHVIGLMHGHQRADRDNYVLILDDNIQQGAESQFWKSPYGVSGASDYDFDSIMHYHNCDFSKYEDTCAYGGPDSEQTIQALSCSRDGVGGDSITALDREAVSRAYSPDFLSLFGLDRNEACGNVAYTETQWAGICANGSCTAANLPAKKWKKVVTQYYKTCGFISAGKELEMCAEVKREYIESWTDTDPLTCGLGDLHELWSKCGCSFVTEKGLCTNYAKPAFADYQKATGKVNWRQGRAIYFLDIARELAGDGLVADDVVHGLTTFVLENYMDRRFETRLAGVRASIYSYARWKRTVDPGYKLDLATFNKIATRHHLRALG